MLFTLRTVLCTLRTVAAVTAAFAFLTIAATAQKTDPALFGALPTIDDAEISPSGKTVAMLQNINGQTAIVFADLEAPSAQPQGQLIGEAVKARAVEWVDDNYLLLLTSVAKRTPTASGVEILEFFRWIAIDRSTGGMKVLFKKDAGFYVTEAGFVIATIPDTPGKAVIARWTPDARAPTRASASRIGTRDIGGGYSLFEVDMKSGRDKIIFPGKKDTVDWIVDARGEALMRIDYDSNRDERKIFRRQQNSKRFTLVKTIKEIEGAGSSITFWGAGDATNKIYATTYVDDKRALVTFDLDAGGTTQTVFRHHTYDITGVHYDPRIASVTGVNYTDDAPRTVHLNPADQKLQGNLGKALPGATLMIVSKSSDGSRMIIRATYANRPDDLYVFDKPTKNLSFFTSTRPAFGERVYGETSNFDYVAPDGMHIPGYLTIPAMAAKQNLPLVVLPHGGPESRDVKSFNWWTDFYAARGYAVYRPNFRGSTGYGQKFREAGYNEWGRKMQSDITNGVKKLIADGVVDADRVCIVGASYGGYAALAGATLTPTLYACAVSVNGVSDLSTLIGEGASKYWQRRIGDIFSDRSRIDAISPLKIAGQAGPPIMLIHGKDDIVVPVYHSRQMRDALSAAGKPHEYVELDGEDHWLSKGETRTQMLRASIAFIDRHIGQ